jgi:hypothetical protein
MLYHFASAKRNYPQWLASHPDGYVLVVKLPFTPAEMPRRPDGSVDIEAFPERIFGSDHVVHQPGGSVEYAASRRRRCAQHPGSCTALPAACSRRRPRTAR